MTNQKPGATGRWLSIVALAAIVGIGVALPGVATAADTDVQAGQQLFQQKGCVACHTIGKGVLVGPDLKGVTAKEPRAWLEQWISAPDAMVAKKDPTAVSLLLQFHNMQMPNLGLSSSNVDAIIDYLAAASSGTATAPAAATSAPAVKGNADLGKELFTGVVRFANGGPPCMACHSVGGIGALGGGQLGPDLTQVGKILGGAAGVSAFIAGTPTPTMNAVWSKRPLTTQERANVVAFLTSAPVTQRPVQAIGQLAGLAVLGVVILLMIATWRWNYRSTFGVRRPMVAKPTTGHTDPRNGGWFTGPYAPGWKTQFRSERR